jgi:hypothetical protein
MHQIKLLCVENTGELELFRERVPANIRRENSEFCIMNYSLGIVDIATSDEQNIGIVFINFLKMYDKVSDVSTNARLAPEPAINAYLHDSSIP